MGRPWTDESDRRLLFLCEETGAGDEPAWAPGLWSPAPTLSFLWGNFCVPTLAVPGPKDWRFAYPSHVFDSVSFLIRELSFAGFYFSLPI